ncbi:MAG: DUF58 domain-containing protein [Rhodocyclaceae bacterium]|nr:DUF58 domain-containing protein [Rhodocyclaceae bacterium]
MFSWLRRNPDPPEAAAGPVSADGSPEALMRRLEWTVLRRLDGLLQGDYRTLFRGFGLDLADLREYHPQDDVRHIDWNVTARMQVPHVREFQEDRQVDAWFLLDLSGSVDFGSTGVRKRLLSAEFTGAMARLLARYGNRVGAMIHAGAGADDGSISVLPARSGRRHVLHLIDRLMSATPPLPAAGVRTDLAQLIRHAQQGIRRRSVVFLVSDFISEDAWPNALDLLLRRHEVVAVRLFDPLERALPDLGLIVMQDAETGEQLYVDTHDKAFRRRFAQVAAARETALRDTLSELGIDCLELATGEAIDEALLRFVDARKRRSQLAAGSVANRTARRIRPAQSHA